MNSDDQALLTRAVAAALSWHGHQTRKGSEVPYAAHFLQIAGLVLEHGGSVEQAAAGLLHDVVEDTEATLAEIEAGFGPNVARMVAECTDTGPDETPERKRPWIDRKRGFVERLAAAGDDSVLVTACDKRHNLTTLVADARAGTLRQRGLNGTPEQQVWYHEQVLERIRGRIPERLESEIEALLAELRSLVGSSA